MDEVFLPPPPVKASAGGVLVPIDLIEAGQRIRAVKEAAVAQIADSIAKNGLISPLLVRPIADDRYGLVIGGHRLSALRLLGAVEVRCEIKDLDDDEALSIELDENLARHELDQLDFAIFCMEREALDERMAQRKSHGGDRKTAKAKSSSQVENLIPRFTAELAETIGRSEKTVYRAIQIAKALDPETVRNLRGTKFANNQAVLMSLSKETPAKQRTLSAAMRDGGVKTLASAKVAAGFEEPVIDQPQMRYLAQLHNAWGLADAATRQTFLDDIDAAYLSVPKPQAPAKPARKGRRA